MRKTKIKTIDVTVLEWFDKANGNSYFAGNVVINYGIKNTRGYHIPFTYGYGSHYMYTAKDKLIEMKEKLPKGDYNLDAICRENNIVLRLAKHENCKKSDLVNLMKTDN